MPVEADSDDTLVFEISRDQIPGDLVLASTELGEVAARAQRTLDEALGKLKPSLRKVVELLKDLAPDEASAEFGLKVGGETGVIVARDTAEVNFVIRMTWKSE